MKYGIIKVKRAFLYEENGVDVVDEVFFGWSVMWEDEGEWIEVWTHYGYRGWMERNLIEEKSREWMEEREKAGNTYVVTRGFADVMRGARVQARMLETLGRGCFVEKMEETENGYCRVKLANEISGFVPEVALRKRLDSDRFLWGKSEERFFVEQGIPEGWSEEKFRRKVVECAKGYLGCQYRWGGKAADGIDCSGVVFMVYLMNGVLIWRDADIREGYPMKAIWREGEEMCLVEERAKAGDLLFWRGHVGMYLGDGRYLHCTGHERVFGCRVNSLRRGDSGGLHGLCILPQQHLAVFILFLQGQTARLRGQHDACFALAQHDAARSNALFHGRQNLFQRTATEGRVQQHQIELLPAGR